MNTSTRLREPSTIQEEIADLREQQRLARFLDGFRTTRGVQQIPAEKSQPRLAELEKLLASYRKARAGWEENQKASADGFNLLKVLKVEYDELRHSMVLAWLLDRRIELGTHAQGNLGFRLFLQELKRELRLESTSETMAYAVKQYWVRREVSGNKSRVDIEIAALREFIIHIEIKILADESEDQTKLEWQDLVVRAESLRIPPKNVHAIFLTPDGKSPASEYFQPVRWSRMANALEEFARKAQPPEVRLFANHFARAVRMLATEPQTKGIQNGEELV